MSNYLSTWESMIPKSQSDWINRFLQREQDLNGLSPSEIKQQLLILTKQLSSGSTKTLSQYYPPVENRLIDPEVYNAMLESMAADLEAAFAESINLSQLLAVYQEIYNHRIIGALRSSLNHIESDLQRLWYMQGSSLGFTDVLIGSFMQTSSITPRSAPLGSILYLDPRTNKMVPVANTASINISSRSLALPVDQQKTVNFTDVKLDTKMIENLLLDREITGSNLKNIIDQKNGTYWILEAITTQPSVAGLDVTLKLDPGSLRDISFIEIQPVSDFPIQVKDLAYENFEGQRSSLIDLTQETALQNQINQPVQLQFSMKQARYLYVRLSQDSFSRITGSSIGLPPPLVPDIIALSGQNTPNTQLRIEDQECYRYSIGCDNLLAGSITYLDTGIYVSEIQRRKTCGLIALEVQEQDLSRNGSVEYYVFKRDYDGNGNILNSHTFPILPLGLQTIEHEVLMLSQNQNISSQINSVCTLRFKAMDGVKVYVEDEEIAASNFSVSPDPTGISTQIKIGRTNSRLHYTVDYQPMHLTTLVPSYLDNIQGPWLGGSNVVHCPVIRSGISVANSDICLIIILRSNPNNLPASPRVLNYKLLTSSVDQEKFYESL